jgi:hypothetical protein
MLLLGPALLSFSALGGKIPPLNVSALTGRLPSTDDGGGGL